MLIGYARTSTLEQINGLEAQREALTKLGCNKIFEEQTGATGQRKALSMALEFVREGDVLVVTKLDRLARSVRHLGELIDGLEARSVGLRILDVGMDTTTASGKLMLNLFGSIAQFEREMMLERQREGIQRAKQQGRYKGRKPTAMLRRDEVHSLLEQGLSKREVARQVGISERSVYRIAVAE